MMPFFAPNFSSFFFGNFFSHESLEPCIEGFGFRGRCDHKRPIWGVLCEAWSEATHNEMGMWPTPISHKIFFFLPLPILS